jgi:hypothetical protein
LFDDEGDRVGDDVDVVVVVVDDVVDVDSNAVHLYAVVNIYKLFFTGTENNSDPSLNVTSAYSFVYFTSHPFLTNLLTLNKLTRKSLTYCT